MTQMIPCVCLQISSFQCRFTNRSRNQTRARQCQDPPTKDEAKLLPTDGAKLMVHENDAHSSSSQALRRRAHHVLKSVRR
ncbi:hypothetical protein Pdw03_7490 [Penicillium digitatum]|uniref:Uncharacterized protein n=1 Tax=Penicillium digitatum TaxID=36651 RepID=A0A7T6XM16_PENDI|nr:hypothetical protein Pdw03_7490 [Penicillium digitatum]